uniref:protein LTO1 homolog isoform X2 n=1 Tax=Erigeron canadensis TaxID=72917 RepID=UPI001CB96A1B|nr:protein LTO1 homolog isoform X2 [Erigeron canadensis]
MNGFNGGYMPTADGEVDKFSERRGFSSSRGAYRGGYANGDMDGERPRRVFERCSMTGRGNDLKRDGAGRGNWGSPTAVPNMDLSDDIFGASINLEDIHLNEGFKEGYDTGFASGKDDGREVGLKTGFITGEELGFYRGCIDVWKSVLRVEPTCFSARVQKNIKEMDELVTKYPILEPENESVTDMMGSLRLKFRAICATLNVKLEYNGYPKASNPNEIQF